MTTPKSQPRSARSGGDFPLFLKAVVMVIVVVGGVFVGISLMVDEKINPGYGVWSTWVSSPEKVAAARATGLELSERKELVNKVGTWYTVACPDAKKWAKLSPADQQMWHRYWQQDQHQTTFRGLPNCYDP